MTEEIVNRVTSSELITINLEDFYVDGERILFDLKNCLYEELILREKDFREFIKTHDWSSYTGKLVAVTCTADAVIPVWAYMLVASALQPYAKEIITGNLETLETVLFSEALLKLDVEKFRNQRIVIKGCGDKPVPAFAYAELTKLLKPVVKSIMYGEPCSTVPVYKAKN